MKCRPSEKLTKDTIYNKVSKIKMMRAEESSIKQLSPGNSHGPFDQQGFVHKMSTRLDSAIEVDVASLDKLSIDLAAVTSQQGAFQPSSLFFIKIMHRRMQTTGATSFFQ